MLVILVTREVIYLMSVIRKQDRQYMFNVPLRHVHGIIVAAEEH